ncbi:MAG TPA: YbhB/YbcL family Raf kinase inhibitor-like protein [bacterium]|nr:YbhB/YbcL family Raf kinase inhibitor-like protein [bacterium]
MKIWSPNFKDGEKIPKEFAFAKRAAIGHFSHSKNHNPHLEWSDLPEGTQSLVLTVYDADAPTQAEDADQENKTLSKDLPRTDFYHWVLVDLPPEGSPIEEAEFSNQVTPHGKSGLNGPRHTRQGVNDFSQWFKGNKEMEGNYFGYDGPAPPWNDERVHHYVFTLYALKEKRCPIRGVFDARRVLKAIEGLVLDKASFEGVYFINPKVKWEPPLQMAVSPA